LPADRFRKRVMGTMGERIAIDHKQWSKSISHGAPSPAALRAATVQTGDIGNSSDRRDG